ncbi:MAG: DEAD/DEAH box helicase [Bdellovibrionales bacterium]
MKTFNEFGLPEQLIKSLTRIQFTKPTPIQEEAIPVALAGRDILGSAQTGTGKTGAFGIPLIAHLMANPEALALVMTPTRELAAQVVASLQSMIPVQDIQTALLIGGDPMLRQYKQLSRNPRLIVGTPGRINDHLEKGRLKLSEARFLVLDEADRMLDMGFGVQIEKIIKQMPEKRQTLMFSATFSKAIVKLSGQYLHKPERIAIGSASQPHLKIKQEIVKTTSQDKYKHLLAELASREGTAIIFVKTKFGTKRLADKLNKDDHTADAIHGDLQQRRRDRVIRSFREKKYRILVATDVAARGLDIPHIEHVINYDLPQCPEDYIHRIGRTARAGAEGEAINLVAPEDHDKWKAIHRLMQGEEVGANDDQARATSKRRGKPPRRSGGGNKSGQKPFSKAGQDSKASKPSKSFKSRGKRPSRNKGPKAA